ncbi:MAG: 50S ribosomal protein L21 [Abditibacteriota bacterium]|jgi:large subunit ribosomal protein L21|nr:50S ribosomal protein L21 [Abditibacteriota bacterium]
MYAIIKTSGRQFKVSENDIISVNRIADVDAGDKVEFGEVLLVVDSDVRVGTPFVEGAKVEGEVIKNYRGKKINGYIYKPKKDYHKKYGHRQDLTAVKISRIAAQG